MPSNAAPLKLAYLVPEYPAVSHTFILREIEALRELGLDIHSCSLRRTPPEQHPGPAEKAEAARTYSILPGALNPLRLLAAQSIAVTMPGRYIRTLWLALRLRSPGIKALVFQLIYFAEATVLARNLRDRSVTHLHAHFANAGTSVALLAAELNDLPFSFTLHGPSDLQAPGYWRLDEKIARARFVSCISHFARSQAMLHSDPRHWNKLRIVHCGVSPELYTATPAPEEGGLRMIFIGRLAPVKGLRVLIESFAGLLKTHPDARLIVVGNGPDHNWLAHQAKGFGNSLVLTGTLSQAEVANELAQSHALVLPSFAEGVPVVLMEAMAAGRPVIATQVAGVSELVENGVNGFIVPPGDAVGLTARMQDLADDPALRRRMGAAGRETVRAEFDIRHEAARLKSLFEGRMGASPRPSPTPRNSHATRHSD